MQVYNSLSEIPYDKNRFITIGSFDGVHRGHGFIIKSLIMAARSNSLKSLVITFEPHPRFVVGGNFAEEFRILTDIEEKTELLSNFGIDELLILPFTKEFSQTKAEEFLQKFLIEKIGFNNILAGYDNFFGQNRSGSSSLLEEYSTKFDYEVTTPGIFRFDNMIISSSLIRRLIRNGSIEEAGRLLGRAYNLNGKIVDGNHLGRTLGFPTINIIPNDLHKLIPGRGVYLTRSQLNGKFYYGMGNIGLRPTLTHDVSPTLEINLFDFSENVYGKPVKTEFLRFIRPEIKFSNAENLVKQMQNDKKKCSELINSLL